MKGPCPAGDRPSWLVPDERHLDTGKRGLWAETEAPDRYHTPVRLPHDAAKEFALAEAKRPGVTLGAVVNEALADLRTKRAQVEPCGKRGRPAQACITTTGAVPQAS